jgi:glutamine synthetase
MKAAIWATARAKGGYFPVGTGRCATDIRAEMVSTLLEMGLPMDKHHHEVAAASTNWA